MTTVACADCGNQVSPRATACPRCGRPVSEFLRPQDARQVVAIEKTSKDLKARGCLAMVLLMLTAIVALFAHYGGDKQIAKWAFVAALLMAIWRVIIGLQTWWRHG